MKNRIVSFILVAVMCAACVCTAFAANPGTASGVTSEMCFADYWKERTLGDSDRVLMTKEDIEQVNKSGVDSKNTYIMGIDTMSETYNADKQRKKMQFAVPEKTLFIDGEKIDKEAYYAKINEAILETGYTETEKESGYAICVKCTTMRYLPTLDSIGYSADDTDDEMAYECITVNEPFLIRGECTIDSAKFYYGYSLDCDGWVPADDFALCESKAQWLDAWQFELDGNDFIVVTQDKITLEPNLIDGYSSNLLLNLSTALKLVPEDKIPASIGGRSSWNNYVVYVPTKNTDGMYEAKPALISQHNSVSIGYLPFTQANVLDVAFGCLGDAYGWGGMLGLYDCSLFTRSVYRCFGIIFPRNTTWQQNVQGTVIKLSDMTDSEKQEIIETLPSGSVLFINGHTMMYTGSVDSIGYVISDLGTVVESSGSNDVLDIFSITLTPLTVRRGAGYNYGTWLHCLTNAVMVMPKTDLASDEVSVKYMYDTLNPEEITAEVTCGGKVLTEGLHYTVTRKDGGITLEGINTFTGTVSGDETDIETEKVSFLQSICNFFAKIIECIKNIFSGLLKK